MLSSLVHQVASFPIPDGEASPHFAALPGDILATARFPDVAIRLWSPDGSLLSTLKGHSSPSSALACGPSGELVSTSHDKKVKVWSGEACVLTCTGHTESVVCVAVSAADGTIVSGSADKTAKVWDRASGACVATLEGHTAIVAAVCVTSDGDVVTGSRDRTVRVWQRGSWTCTAVLDQVDQVWSLAALPGGGFAVCGGCHAAGFVSVWRGGSEEWTLATERLAIQVVSFGGVVAVCTRTAVHVVDGGESLHSWVTKSARIALLSGGRLAVADRGAVDVYRVVRWSRLAAIHVMVAAWSRHGGSPPAPSDAVSQEAALTHTLSLRRFCRPREGTLEVVEPFARDVVGFM